MKWCTFHQQGRTEQRVGVLIDDDSISALPLGTTLLGLLESDELTSAGAQAIEQPAEVVPLTEVTLLPPIPRPPSFRDFMSFEEHLLNSAKAMGVPVPQRWYDSPVFYFSNPASFQGPTQPVTRPPGVAALDFELEVAVVVGRGGRDLTPEQAVDHIAGYLVLCDWSARDLQRGEIPLTMGPFKSKDFASSVSGFLVTPDEVDPERTARPDLAMTASVNGEKVSQGQLGTVHWSFAEMLAEASRNTVIHPGDVIGSGTVSTGCLLELSILHGADRYDYLVPGDTVHLAVDGIGEIAVPIR
ncbi:fumarylacetoacetate hydrolase family protein [Nocardioides sp. Bht2]|uniref:fumarylacetoacetate hydrolase family protein n=1 Tax=Nocardioides sp. Bht2 TaxID=3392297 RepID=UPI0039B4BF9D